MRFFKVIFRIQSRVLGFQNLIVLGVLGHFVRQERVAHCHQRRLRMGTRARALSGVAGISRL